MRPGKTGTSIPVETAFTTVLIGFSGRPSGASVGMSGERRSARRFTGALCRPAREPRLEILGKIVRRPPAEMPRLVLKGRLPTPRSAGGIPSLLPRSRKTLGTIGPVPAARPLRPCTLVVMSLEPDFLRLFAVVEIDPETRGREIVPQSRSCSSHREPWSSSRRESRPLSRGPNLV